MAAPRRTLLFLAAVLLPHLRKIIIQPLVRKTDAEQPTSRQLNKLMRHEAHEIGIKSTHSNSMEIQDVACALDKALIGR